MNYNFHTHTYHCHHASGTPEEYVLCAIKNGVTEMGFSDHFPFDFGDGTYNSARIPVSEVDDYLREIRALQEKYRDKIKLHLGFEMEYYAELFVQMRKKAKEYGAEYLLLGEHYARPENDPTSPHSSLPCTDGEHLSLYTDRVIEAIETGCFTYVAHPDMLNFIGSEALFRAEARRIALASKKHGVPLEINFLGIRDSRNYPSLPFWEEVARVGSPVTFGFDAHSVNTAYDENSLAVAKKMVKDLGLNYIGKPVLRRI